jgi:hypothetical protein
MMAAEERRAGDETRTRDIFLGKEVLYQLSYTREADANDAEQPAVCQSQDWASAGRKLSFRLPVAAGNRGGWFGAPGLTVPPLSGFLPVAAAGARVCAAVWREKSRSGRGAVPAG